MKVRSRQFIRCIAAMPVLATIATAMLVHASSAAAATTGQRVEFPSHAQLRVATSDASAPQCLRPASVNSGSPLGARSCANDAGSYERVAYNDKEFGLRDTNSELCVTVDTSTDAYALALRSCAALVQQMW